jgi:polyisoprenoid-binding protein YceI
MENKKFVIETAQSNIDWVGRKVTGAHNGTISIKEGSLILTDGQLAGGEFTKFTIDTTSIKILDVTDAGTNAQFAGHLASADFFASEQYPEAKFVITLAEPAGENNITRPVSFTAVVNNGGDTFSASGKVVVDRTLYDMKFRSGNFFKDLGDTLIYNNFDLNVSITAKAA